MILQTTLIICGDDYHKFSTDHSLLGLTIGQRLFYSLRAGGITNIAFIGPGKRPRVERGGLKTMDVEELRSTGENFIAVPSDLVFNPVLLSNPDAIPKNYPIRYFNCGEWNKVADLSDGWPNGWQNGTDRNFAIRVIDRESAILAERALLRSLGKRADGVISRNINRKISTTISRHLAPYPIRPNHITTAVFLIGIISGPLAWQGTYSGFAGGAFCYWLSAVLDGCDGEISRLKYQGSALGAWLDTIVDDLVCLSYVTGMYMALARNAESSFWSWCGGFALIFYLITLLPRYYIMAYRLGSGDYQKIAEKLRSTKDAKLSKFIQGCRDVIFRCDFLPFYAMSTAFIGFVPAFALPFAVGTIITAIDTMVTLFTYSPTPGNR